MAALATLLMAMSIALKSENNMEKKKNVKAVEIVIFSFKEKYSDQPASEKAMLVNDFISNQSGFISRTTSKLDGDKWIDIVYWESMQEAKDANGAAMKCEPCGAFFNSINQEPMQFMHGETFVEIR